MIHCDLLLFFNCYMLHAGSPCNMFIISINKKRTDADKTLESIFNTLLSIKCLIFRILLIVQKHNSFTLFFIFKDLIESKHWCRII